MKISWETVISVLVALFAWKLILEPLADKAKDSLSNYEQE